jgi:hypothetical protein
MSNSNLQSLAPQPLRKRQNRSEHDHEHKQFLNLVAQKNHPLVIRHELRLASSQFNKHLAEAVEAGELTNLAPVDYAVIRYGSLQSRDRKEINKRLQLDIQPSALLKFEMRDGEIICSIIQDADTSFDNEEGRNL